MPNIYDQTRACLIYDPTELQYDFGDGHPFNQQRLIALMDLMATSGLWRPTDKQPQLPLRPATSEELGLIHTQEYITAVQKLSAQNEKKGSEEIENLAQLAASHGFEDGDTPAFPGMHEGAALVTGGTLVALSAVMGLPEGGTFATEEERPLHVFHPAGGLHHAWEDRASGFCVYNDIAVAIAHVLRASEAKIMYIDFDAHHGDGVQRAFYDDPRVMTVSFHETGRYLYPGTGDVVELGKGSGRGYSVNIPLEPYTEDDSFTSAIEDLLPPLLTRFAPDVLITLHGCDTHAWDPLTHLKLTLKGIQEQMKMTHQLAHTFCKGRWVALGGGGYDIFRVLPRAWSMLWAEISDQQLPVELPQEWISRWKPAWKAIASQEMAAQQVMGKSSMSIDFPRLFQDKQEDFPAAPRRHIIERTNRQTVGLLRQLVLPIPLRHAFPVARRQSPLAGLFAQLHPNGSTTPSRVKVIESKAGPILLRDFCPPSLIERLTPDEGLHAFANFPDREHQLMLNIAKQRDCALTIAHTPAGQIIGQVTIAPGDEWWEGFENVYEVAVEISTRWRKFGLSHLMLDFALELDALEDMIFFALGFSWHWDTEGLGINIYRYRELIKGLFAARGFVEYATTEPNISSEPGNILMVRIGNRVDQQVVDRFLKRLQSSSNISGIANF